jgi:thiol-disulfide isomerase/thioredoxin
MGKASRLKQQTAREKIAAQRAAERRAERRRQLLITGGSVLLVAVIVVAFVLVKTLGGGPSAKSGPASGTPLPASVAASITSVPASTLDAVGTGSAYPKSVTPISGTPLSANGKPEVLYIGAEYCPYCATERWAVTVALSRFGHFAGLHGIHSSSTDVYPSTPTLTFYKASYTSPYLVFTPVETTTVNRNVTLQTPTAAQSAVWRKYDPTGTIPFIDLGGRYLISGAQYNPQVLHGLTWSQVAAALHNKSSAVAQSADGAANMITSALCRLTGNRPAGVCDSPVIKSLEGQL